MLTVETRHAVHPDHAGRMGSDELRRHFLAEGLFAAGEIRLVYTHYDRMIVGAAVPAGGALTLDKVEETKTATLLERREMGIVNIGGAGTVSTGDERYSLEPGDVLYLGKGNGAVSFAGEGRFYIVSTPAHARFPNRLIRIGEAAKVELGAAATSNERVINQFIHPTVMESCQLVLGYTTLLEGSVWNTMPCHVHDRRMEAYLYWGMAPEARVIHLMGEPRETRHLIVANEQAAISPSWSIHSGAGTGSYSFIWAMAGDNVDFTDMDFIQPAELR